MLRIGFRQASFITSTCKDFFNALIFVASFKSALLLLDHVMFNPLTVRTNNILIPYVFDDAFPLVSDVPHFNATKCTLTFNPSNMFAHLFTIKLCVAKR